MNAGDGRYVIGADLGGTAIKLGLFSEDGQLAAQRALPTPQPPTPAAVTAAIAAEAEALSSMVNNRRQVVGLGLGLPGPVSHGRLAQHCPNLGWTQADVVSPLEARLGLPVRADNDANLAAWGEHWQGAGQGHDDLLLLTLGTGLGGGLILRGQPYGGAHGGAGELGHLDLGRPGAYTCNCGHQGCWETFCSAPALLALARTALAGGQPSRLRQEELTPAAIFRLAAAGDVLAGSLVWDFCAALGQGLAAACAALDPGLILLGGGLAASAELFWPQLEREFRQRAFSVQAATELRPAALGNRAGIYGAARLALLPPLSAG